MKINLTHAAIGLGVLFLVLHAVKANKARSSNGQDAPVQDASVWWTYAGQWGN